MKKIKTVFIVAVLISIPILLFGKDDRAVTGEDTPKMREAYEMYVLGEGNPAFAMNNEANFYLIKGDTENAILKYLEALKVSPGNVLISNNLSWAYIVAGKYERAKKLLEKTIVVAKEGASTNFYLGVVNLKLGNINDAKKYLEKAVELDSNHPYSHYYLAKTYEAEGFIQKAVLEAETAAYILGDVWNPEVALYLGNLYGQAGMFQKAILQYTKLVDEPEYAFEAYYGLGVSYGHFNDFDRSEKNFLKAKEFDKKDPRVYFGLGKIYSTKEDELGKALKNAEKALSLDEKNPRYFHLIGWIYYKMGEYEDALKHFRLAQKYDPENKEYGRQIRTLERALNEK
ncbi:MAG: tetratricopeptide repeat protein [Deltaproteobacteria bacterium]|uniref:Tetratricopeptide repeat protein n=1 Tax=Candidatus Zymogenus saltonus TaxID=2844893 RepID=A0A9D8PLW4_9DELT|nr:tetratricopeptide repeat protein [Candidatus Zymogenus saltonus]